MNLPQDRHPSVGADDIRVVGPPTHPPQVVTVGETMGLVQAESPGSFAHAGSARLSVGGAESNVAIGLSRLGTSSAWVGRVGDDGMGERVIRQIRAEGVSVHAVIGAARPTGLMLKSRPTSGHTKVEYYRTEGAGAALVSTDVPEGLIESAGALHITGISAVLSDSTYLAITSAVRRAHAAGINVTFDINHRQSLDHSAQAEERYRKLVAYADVIFGGADELALVNPRPDRPESLRSQLETSTEGDIRSGLVDLASTLGCTVVLKRGPRGAAQATARGDYASVDGLEVEVIDTVGAGDAFVAGYLSAYLEGLDAEKVLNRANACGAIMCTHPGDWEAAARLDEIDRLLNGNHHHDPVQR